MKIVILAVLVLAAGGVGVLFATGRLGSAESRSCARLEKLCGKDGAVAPERCTQVFAELRRVGGDASVEKTAACLQEAETCAAGAGCVVGGIGGGLLGEFARGLQKSLR